MYSRGIDAGQIAVIDVLHYVSLVLLEIPCGLIADRIGRRRTLQLSCMLAIFVFLGIGFIENAGLLIAVWIVWGLLIALSSGSETAYTWEAAVQSPCVGSPEKFFGFVRFVSSAAAFISVVSAGYLIEVWLPLPFVVTSVLAGVAVVLVCGLPREAVNRTRERYRFNELFRLTQSRGRLVVFATLSLALVSAAAVSIRILYQPLGIDLGISTGKVGLAYGVIVLCGGLGALLCSGLSRMHRIDWALVLIAIFGAMNFVVGTLGKYIPGEVLFFVVIPLSVLISSISLTVLDLLIVQNVGFKLRATVLSVASAMSGLVMFGVRPLLLLLHSDSGAYAAFAIFGLSVFILGMLLAVLALARGGEPIRVRPGAKKSRQD